MLTSAQLQKWFESNNISLTDERLLTTTEVDELFISADKCGRSFGSFILYTVINVDRNGINTCFRNWNTLYEDYCSFMVGFMSTTGTSNN